MKKQKIGNNIIIGAVVLNVVLWLAFSPADTLETNYTLQFIGEVIASTAMILMAISLILAARLRFMEPYYGGLDKLWQTHKKVSMLSFLLLVIHFFSIPKTAELLNGKPLGMISFLGILILVLLTIAPRVPLISRVLNFNYTIWRLAHKFMGVFFILGMAHYLLVGTISQQTVPGMYMFFWVVIGIVAFIYRQFFSRLVEPYRDYVVESVKHLNGTSVEISLKPTGSKKVNYKAGQFVYLSFKERYLREPHPFTVSSSPNEENLRFAIKASGDWTGYLVKNLEKGMDASVFGAFGMFDNTTGGKEQVWIAGGIGVTPFLSWIRGINGRLSQDVDFFYGVRSEADGLFWDEFEAADNANDTFRAHIQHSTKDGHLSSSDVADMCKGDISKKDIYLCGPIAMTEGFARQFGEMGVPSGQIHYEEFNFR